MTMRALSRCSAGNGGGFSARLMCKGLGVLAARGVEVEALYAQVGVRPADFEDAEARIPYETLYDLFERGAELSRAPSLGLLVTRQDFADPEDPAMLVALTSATL